ncbi:MAG: hypothetical protein PVI21_05290 [Candidatus Woesebacteria bacterium]|jgi:hypothetical protein
MPHMELAIANTTRDDAPPQDRAQELPHNENDIIITLIAHGLDAYLDDITKQEGYFSGHPAKFRYSVEQDHGVWVSRIDVIYPRNNDKHGHLVIKDGQFHYWRLPGGTVVINN